jgi:hypothetical protein
MRNDENKNKTGIFVINKTYIEKHFFDALDQRRRPDINVRE